MFGPKWRHHRHKGLCVSTQSSAISFSFIHTVSFLIKNNNGMTPFLEAVAKNNVTIAKLLLDKGDNVNQKVGRAK
jgi:ankyrin repeat protein